MAVGVGQSLVLIDPLELLAWSEGARRRAEHSQCQVVVGWHGWRRQRGQAVGPTPRGG